MDSRTNSDTELVRQALLSDLESSLRLSQQAILARDLEKLEGATEKQAQLHRRLHMLPALEEESASSGVVEAHRRVLALGRVQGALLMRAEQRLRMLANLIAGSQAEYRPAASGAGILVQVPAAKEE